MLVIKRDGRRESVKFDKVTARIEKLCYGLHMDFVSPIEVAKKVIDGIYDGVTTVELDNLAAETAASDRKSTRLNSSHSSPSRMPSSA